jgi:hypothetical protein
MAGDRAAPLGPERAAKFRQDAQTPLHALILKFGRPERN